MQNVFRTTAIGVLSGALLTAACAPTQQAGAPVGGATETTSAPRAAIAPAERITVGLMVPLSSNSQGAATLAQSLETAARMSMQDLGAAPFDLRVYDTAGDPARAGEIAVTAMSEGIDVVVGPLFAATTTAVANAVSARGLTVFSFSTDASIAGDNIYLTGYLPAAEARRIVGFAVSRGYRGIGLFYPETPQGNAYASGVREAALGLGAAVVADQGYERSFAGIQSASGPFADSALATGVGAVVLPEQGEGLRSAAAFMDFAGLGRGTVQYLGVGGWDSRATMQEPALQGGLFPAPEPDRLRLFAEAYASRYGAQPHKLAVLGYDGIQIVSQLLDAARSTGSSDPFAPGTITRPTGFRGALGPIRFDTDGTSERGLAILEVGPGGFTTVDPPPDSFGAGS